MAEVNNRFIEFGLEDDFLATFNVLEKLGGGDNIETKN
jgi:hypothetical protein